MKVLLDACVLYPTFLRDVLLSYAQAGGFTPLWSERILEEWRRAAAQHGARDAEIAGVEIESARALFPEAMVMARHETELRLSLPDADDEHVLAAAIDGGAEALLTLNVKDFPTRVLSGEGILRRAPDEFLLEGYHFDPAAMASLIEGAIARAAAHGIEAENPRKLLKRARLPRLGKALYQA